MKTILFITPYAFNQTNGGAVLFKKFFSNVKYDLLDWFICSDRIKSTLLTFKFRNIYSNFNFFFDHAIINVLARKFYLIGLFFFFLKYRFFSRILQKKLVQVCKKNGIDFLWIYASHSSISVSASALRKIQLNYHLSIQDDVHTHLPAFESKFLEDDFKFLIENASTIDFISDDMEQYYRQMYNIGAKTTTFLVGDYLPTQAPNINSKISRIGFAGNVWCPENFVCLLESIRAINLETKSKIKLIVYSDIASRSFFDNFEEHVCFNAVISYEDLMGELQKCDLLYLPMTFKESAKITNKTSFPSKILTYLNAKVPILNHSPQDAVSHKFILSKEVGYSINTCEVMPFIKELKDLLNYDNYSSRAEFSRNSECALKPFDSSVMIPKLQKLIFY